MDFLQHKRRGERGLFRVDELENFFGIGKFLLAILTRDVRFAFFLYLGEQPIEGILIFTRKYTGISSPYKHFQNKVLLDNGDL